MATAELDLAQPLVELNLFKATPKDGEDDSWRFAGVASDSTPDEVGDALLKSILDVSYAQNRGYVNWNHSQQPADQIGWLTKTSIIDGQKEIEELSKSLGTELSPTATVYVEGELYKHVDQAIAVQKIMKSSPPGYSSLGLSLEGGLARNKASGRLVKAIVRGVSITHKPAHVLTMMTLRKSLQQDPDTLFKTVDGMSYDEAVLWVLRKRPTWTGELAEKFVHFTIQTRQGVTER